MEERRPTAPGIQSNTRGPTAISIHTDKTAAPESGGLRVQSLGGQRRSKRRRQRSIASEFGEAHDATLDFFDALAVPEQGFNATEARLDHVKALVDVRFEPGDDLVEVLLGKLGHIEVSE